MWTYYILQPLSVWNLSLCSIHALSITNISRTLLPKISSFDKPVWKKVFRRKSEPNDVQPWNMKTVCTRLVVLVAVLLFQLMKLFQGQPLLVKPVGAQACLKQATVLRRYRQREARVPEPSVVLLNISRVHRRFPPLHSIECFQAAITAHAKTSSAVVWRRSWRVLLVDFSLFD